MQFNPKFGPGTIVADNLTADEFLAIVEDGNAHFGGCICMLCATQPFTLLFHIHRTLYRFSTCLLVSIFTFLPAMDRIAPPSGQQYGIPVNDT